MLVEAREREAGLLDDMVGYRRTRLMMVKDVWWELSIIDFEEADGRSGSWSRIEGAGAGDGGTEREDNMLAGRIGVLLDDESTIRILKGRRR